MADYHLIMDLVPNLAKIYFLYDVENLNKPHLGAIQQAILTGIGLQCKTVDILRYLSFQMIFLTKRIMNFVEPFDAGSPCSGPDSNL